MGAGGGGGGGWKAVHGSEECERFGLCVKRVYIQVHASTKKKREEKRVKEEDEDEEAEGIFFRECIK